jgi:hypothetical protein
MTEQDEFDREELERQAKYEKERERAYAEACTNFIRGLTRPTHHIAPTKEPK